MKTTFTLAFSGSIVLGLMMLGSNGVCQQTPVSTSKTVLLHVAVSSSGGGGFASGVRRDSFLVVSDNVARQITLFQNGPIPSSICIVLDATKRLSMLRTPEGNIVLDSLIKGLAEFHNLPLQTEYSIVGFGEHPQLLLDWTKDLHAVESAVGAVELKGRQSALYEACFMALEKLGQSENQKRVLLIISGSSDNKSRRKFSELRQAVRQNGYLVYPIGIFDTNGPRADIQDDAQWESEMRELGTVSGGLLRFAGTPDSVLFQFSNLSLELQRQYMIGFETKDELQKGKYHKVQLKLGGTQSGLKGLNVRTREGYSGDED
jgi:VWFA-related protein